MHAEAGVGMRPEAPDPDRPERRHLPATSFRSRRSALSGAQRQTWERLWPKLGLSMVAPPGGPGAEPLDTPAWFGRRAPLLLEHLIAPGSLIGVRVFFPDPWPKARHHKRRFLQPATIGLIADRLLPGGVLHAATDHPGYAEQIAEVGDAEPLLCRVDRGTRLPISVARPTTKYETKAQEAGSAVTEFIWKRPEKAEKGHKKAMT